MQIDNTSPWATQLAPAWGKDRMQQMTLVVKTGYRWDDEGSLTPLMQGEITIEAGERFYQDDAENASVAAGNDTVPFKHGFEILATGTAHTINPKANVTTVSIALVDERNGQTKTQWMKTLSVFGKRRWQRRFLSVMPTVPEALVPTPIRYELAYGGKKLDSTGQEKKKKGRFKKNPVGQGFAANGKEHWLPQIEQAPLIKRKGQRVEPAGFGPVATTWEPRWPSFENLDDAAAQAGRCFYEQPVNERMFNCAPQDQQFSEPPAEGLMLQLTGLHATHKTQTIPLPEAQPQAMVYINEQWEALPLACDTLIIDADNQVLYQLWRGARHYNPARVEMMTFNVSDARHEQWLQAQADDEPKLIREQA